VVSATTIDDDALNQRSVGKRTLLSFAHLLSNVQLQSLMSAADRRKLTALVASQPSRFLDQHALQRYRDDNANNE
jgi:hypothetical protein